MEYRVESLLGTIFFGLKEDLDAYVTFLKWNGYHFSVVSLPKDDLSAGL